MTQKLTKVKTEKLEKRLEMCREVLRNAPPMPFDLIKRTRCVEKILKEISSILRCPIEELRERVKAYIGELKKRKV